MFGVEDLISFFGFFFRKKNAKTILYSTESKPQHKLSVNIDKYHEEVCPFSNTQDIET